MRRVILESPYAGEVESNVEYARRAMRDSLKRGEAPMVSHLLYTQGLDDTDAAERALGIEAGLAWGAAAERTVVYMDRGISRGMLEGMTRAVQEGRPIELRWIGKIADVAFCGAWATDWEIDPRTGRPIPPA